ncbi:Helix-turn-helix domain-containing protein [Paenibacillus sp. UNCCL117]|nr:Helix-turn-helix domain-containing protein [Paenibacillus sp. cl123]SFW58047.1 Helix-turn-helix domain-containing protein [Paenibacillus sp. UNCCL117]
MTNILIVDDEILVRLSLKTLIPWTEHGFRIVGEAQSGEEALAILERLACHIVLTDIRMPDMDGLELISRIRQQWPQTRCLILSNHNDFEYVQQALRLGAVDYSLKLAWVPEELLEKCVRLQEEIRQEELLLAEQHRTAFRMDRLDRESKAALLRNLLTKHTSKVELDSATADVAFEFDIDRYCVALIGIDRYERVLEENRFESEQLLSYTVANVLDEIMRKHGTGELVEISSGYFALISSDISPNLLQQMQEVTGTFIKISISAGISQTHNGLGSLYPAYSEARSALQQRFLRGSGALIFAGGQPPPPAAEETARSSETADAAAWLKLLETKQDDAIVTEAERWFERWTASGYVQPEVVRDELLHLLYVFNNVLERAGTNLYAMPAYEGRYPFEVVRNGETLSEIRVWLTGWLKQSTAYARDAAGVKYRPEIQHVLEIIRNEYHTPLKVSEIAKRVGFAENYLSVLFRKETGSKIVDYLTNVRMEKARELLKDPAYKIYEISEMVGYGDPNHFSKYFKKIEGMFPAEFRKLCLGK